MIDDHQDRFGVEPIGRVPTEHACKIDPSTYYAHSLVLPAPAFRCVSPLVRPA